VGEGDYRAPTGVFKHQPSKYRAQRLAKFQQTRCSECAAKLIEEQKWAAEALPKKGEALKSLPAGTQVSPVPRKRRRHPLRNSDYLCGRVNTLIYGVVLELLLASARPDHHRPGHDLA
jgi:hypothetical protein